MANMRQNSGSGLTLAALGVAGIALAGSLYLSMGMNLQACPLCFYQRTFVMAVVGILGVGLLTPLRSSGYLSLLSLPAAVGAVGVAGFHVYLEVTDKLECPKGVYGIGTAPQQSLAALAILALILVTDALRKHPVVGLVAVILGGFFTWAALASTPPLPAPKPTDPDKPIEICRPPHKP